MIKVARGGTRLVLSADKQMLQQFLKMYSCISDSCMYTQHTRMQINLGPEQLIY